MNRALALLTIIFLFCLFASPASSAMHRWVDEKGRVWITDYPDPKTTKAHKGNAARESTQTEEPSAANPDAEKSEQKTDIPGLSSLPENLQKDITDFMRGEGTSLMSASTLAMISGFLLVFGIAFYIYICLCLYIIARKVGVSDPWTAWVPVINLWTFVDAAGKPWWWLAIIVVLSLLSVIPMAGIILGLVNIGIIIYLWMCISENLGKNRWLGLLMLVPIVNLFYPAVLAFSKVEPIPEADSSATPMTGRH